jgi:hypothetical protein
VKEKKRNEKKRRRRKGEKRGKKCVFEDMMTFVSGCVESVQVACAGNSPLFLKKFNVLSCGMYLCFE